MSEKVELVVVDPQYSQISQNLKPAEYSMVTKVILIVLENIL